MGDKSCTKLGNKARKRLHNISVSNWIVVEKVNVRPISFLEEQYLI